MADDPKEAGGAGGAGGGGPLDEAAAAAAQAVAEAQAQAAAAAEQSAEAQAKVKVHTAAIRDNAIKIAEAYNSAAAAAQQSLGTATQERDIAAAILEAVRGTTEQKSQLANISQQAAAAAAKEREEEWQLLTAAERREATLLKEIELHADKRAKLSEQVAENNQILNSSERIGQLAQQFNGNVEAARSSLQAQNVEYNNAQDLIDQIVKLLTQKVSKLSKANQEVNRFSGMTKDVLSKFTGITDQSQGMIGSLVKAGQSTDGWATAMQGVQKGMRETLSTTNIIISSFEKAQEAALFLAKNEWDVAKALNNAEKSFMRSTGAGEKYRNAVHDITQANRDIIPSYDKAAQMAGELYNNFHRFVQLGPEAQSQMTRFAVVLERVGVGANTTTDTLNNMTKTLRMTEQDSASATAGLTGFALQLGVQTNTALQQFNQLSRDYASFGGPKLIQTFRRLSVIAKITGTEMNTLTGIAKKFDTFEGAASNVGQLNAILGGPYLNTLKMINTIDPAERVRLVKDAVDKAGLSFDQMGAKSHYLKKTIAEMFTGGDMAEAERLFGTQSAAIQNAQNAALGYKGSLQGLEAQVKRNETMEEAANSRRMTMASNTKDLSQGIDKLNGLLQRGADFINNWGVVGTAAATGLAAVFGGMLLKSVMGVGSALGDVAKAGSTALAQVAAAGANSGNVVSQAAQTMSQSLGGVSQAAGSASIGIKGMLAAAGPIVGIITSLGVIGTQVNSLGKEMGWWGRRENLEGNAMPAQSAARGRDGIGGPTRIHPGEMLVTLPQHTNVISNSSIQRQEQNISTLQNMNSSIMQMLSRPVQQQASAADVQMAQDLKRIVNNTRETSNKIVQTSLQKESSDRAMFHAEMSMERATAMQGGGSGNVQVTVTPTPISIQMDGREIYKLIEAWHGANISINR